MSRFSYWWWDLLVGLNRIRYTIAKTLCVYCALCTLNVNNNLLSTSDEQRNEGYIPDEVLVPKMNLDIQVFWNLNQN